MGAPSHEQRGQAGCGGGCILIPCLGQKAVVWGCHVTPIHLRLHSEDLEGGGAQPPCCALTALRDCIPPPPRFFHPDSRFPIAVATSGMATLRAGAFCKGMSHMCPPHPWGPPPPRLGGGNGRDAWGWYGWVEGMD